MFSYDLDQIPVFSFVVVALPIDFLDSLMPVGPFLLQHSTSKITHGDRGEALQPWTQKTLQEPRYWHQIRFRGTLVLITWRDLDIKAISYITCVLESLTVSATTNQWTFSVQGGVVSDPKQLQQQRRSPGSMSSMSRPLRTVLCPNRGDEKQCQGPLLPLERTAFGSYLTMFKSPDLSRRTQNLIIGKHHPVCCFLERVKSEDFGKKPTQISPLAGWPWRDTHLSIDRGHLWEFPGGPVAKTLCYQCRGVWVRSLVRELDPTCCNERCCMRQEFCFFP